MESDVRCVVESSRTTLCRRRRKRGEEEEGEFTFACPICFKKFKTGQALGGHQNAHRQERSHHLVHPFISAAAYVASRSPTLWNFHSRESPQPCYSSPMLFFPPSPSSTITKETSFITTAAEEHVDGGVSVVSSERTESDSCCTDTVSDMAAALVVAGEDMEMDLELRLGGR